MSSRAHDSEPILITADADGVRTLTFSRPSKKNAFTPALADALESALAAADADDDVRVAVLRGAGDCFTAGADVTLFLAAAGDDAGAQAEAAKVGNVHRHLAAFTKPLIAAVHGQAIGMGTTMLPHCDLVYAAADASFLTPFVRLGLVQEFGSSYTLPRLIGRQRANELILGATPIDAETAASWGLVNRVLPSDGFFDAVASLAADLARAPSASLVAAKSLLRFGQEHDLEASIAREDETLERFYGGPANRRAVEAFLASRRAR